jgi:hypothetical protein
MASQLLLAMLASQQQLLQRLLATCLAVCLVRCQGLASLCRQA